MKKLLTSLSIRQRITIATVLLAILGGVFTLVRWNREKDFKPLFSNLGPEDAAAIVQKLKESGTDYRLPEEGGTVLVPSAKLAELRLSMAAAGVPHSGRIGFELFDKTNFGTTEFTEHINYRRALEGELERSVQSLAEVELARVHITFPKDSVFLEAQQPAKASVMVKLKPDRKLSPQNVQAINHLVSSAVEGLAPTAVAIIDMRGNLLGRPRRAASPDGTEPDEETLEFRRKIEADLLAKVNGTLEPLLGAEKYRAGVSVECDFTGGEQSDEVLDPNRSVMLSSQRTEDSTATAAANGVPGTASSLPRPTSRPAAGSGGLTRVTENITYQTSRSVKRIHMGGGTVRRISLAVLVDQGVRWDLQKGSYQRVLIPPPPEKLKVIRDTVAGIAGFDAQRGDQITVETLPFESTLNLEPPPLPIAPAVPGAPGAKPQPQAPEPPLVIGPWKIERQYVRIAAAAGAGILLLLLLVAGMAVARRRSKRKTSASATGTLPAGAANAAVGAGAATALSPAQPDIFSEQVEAQIAEREAAQAEAESRALDALRIRPVITKTAEILAKHLRESIKKQPEVPAHILRSWIREEDV